MMASTSEAVRMWRGGGGCVVHGRCVLKRVGELARQNQSVKVGILALQQADTILGTFRFRETSISTRCEGCVSLDSGQTFTFARPRTMNSPR